MIPAYKHGALSVAYPIAVAVATVLIALGATIWPWGILSIKASGGIVDISCGVSILVVSWGTGAVTKAFFYL